MNQAAVAMNRLNSILDINNKGLKLFLVLRKSYCNYYIIADDARYIEACFLNYIDAFVCFWLCIYLCLTPSNKGIIKQTVIIMLMVFLFANI